MQYIKNLIIIFMSFFEYGFLRRSNTSSSGKSSYTDEIPEDMEGNMLQRVEHYWEYLTLTFPDLDTIKYINFYYDEANSNKEKGLGWILLALNAPGEFERVFYEIFSSPNILSLYNKEESYFWKSRKELLGCC